ncbi:MAG: peptide chain release factor N(5)-glutamine methyltransferase, partial [Microbacteriaceae bacterium]
MSEAVAALRDRAAAALAGAGVPDPEVDAELLLAHVLGVSRGGVQAKLVTGGAAPEGAAEALAPLVERRSAREPLQHILGLAAFRHLELEVGPGVFVPRPETETLAQLAIDAALAAAGPSPRVVDLCTGSGAVALAVGTEVPHAEVAAVELSPEAFVWARRNRERAGAENVRMVFGDLAEALPEWDGTVDVVVSNPPYIPLGAIPRDPEVRLFDPELALYGGEDGLDVVRSLSRRALALLHPGGFLVIEHGELQGADIRALLTA